MRNLPTNGSAVLAGTQASHERPMPGKDKTVAMLIVSPGNDIRAKKEADVLLDAGYDVKFIGRNPAIRTPTRIDDDRHTVLQMPTVSNAASLRALLHRNRQYYTFRERVIGQSYAALMDFTGFKLGWSPTGLGNMIDGRDFLFHRRVKSYFQRKADALREFSAKRRSVLSLLLAALVTMIGTLGSRPYLILLLPLILPIFVWSLIGLPFHALYKRMTPALDRSWSRLTRTDNPFSAPGAMLIAIAGPIVGLVSFLFIRNPKALLEFIGKVVTWPFRKARARVLQAVAPRMRLYHQMLSYFIYHLEVKPAVIEMRPDIVHAHDLYMLQAASRAGKEIGAAVIYDAHELETDRHKDQLAPLQSHIKDQEIRFGSKVNGVITVSDSIADILRDNLNRPDVTLVYNSPMVRDVEAESDLRSDIGLSDKDHLVVFIGKLYNIHNHDHRINNLIEAMAYVPEAHLAILGKTSPNAKAEIAVWAARYFVSDRVHVMEPVPYESLLSYVRTADIGVNPMENKCLNTEYSMPNKIFEMTLAGLPVAQSNLSESVRFLERLNMGVPMDATNPRDMARAIMTALSDRKAMTPAPQMLAELRQDYGWQAQGDKLLKLYARTTNTAA